MVRKIVKWRLHFGNAGEREPANVPCEMLERCNKLHVYV